MRPKITELQAKDDQKNLFVYTATIKMITYYCCSEIINNVRCPRTLIWFGFRVDFGEWVFFFFWKYDKQQLKNVNKCFFLPKAYRLLLVFFFPCSQGQGMQKFTGQSSSR